MKGENYYCSWESLEREPSQGQAGFGAQLGSSRCLKHSGCGSNKACETSWLFGNQKGLS